MHPEAFAFVDQTLHELKLAPASVVEIGSRNINGGIRMLFDGCASYVGIDLYPGVGVDVVADAVRWRPAVPVDLVVCCEVLEHCPDPQRLIRAAYEMLRPGGTLILTAASHPRAPHSGLNGEALRSGEHYENIGDLALRGWLLLFSASAITVDHARGDIYAWARK